MTYRVQLQIIERGLKKSHILNWSHLSHLLIKKNLTGPYLSDGGGNLVQVGLEKTAIAVKLHQVVDLLLKFWTMFLVEDSYN